MLRYLILIHAGYVYEWFDLIVIWFNCNLIQFTLWCNTKEFIETLFLELLHLQKHNGVADPLEVVAGEVSDESILLCLDEFMVMRIV